METTMTERILEVALAWSIATATLVRRAPTLGLRIFWSATLLCAPYCTYAKAKPIIKEAKGLVHDYESWKSNAGITLDLDLTDSDDDNGNFYAIPTSLLRVRENWESHLKTHEKRMRSGFFGFLSIAVPIFCATSVNANVRSTILGPVLVSRCIMCAIHLGVFHIFIGPQVRRLSFVMENLVNSRRALSISWIAMSSALSAILWTFILLVLVAVELVLRSQNILHDSPLEPVAIIGLMLSVMLPDVLFLVWVCRGLQKRRFAV